MEDSKQYIRGMVSSYIIKLNTAKIQLTKSRIMILMEYTKNDVLFMDIIANQLHSAAQKHLNAFYTGLYAYALHTRIQFESLYEQMINPVVNKYYDTIATRNFVFCQEIIYNNVRLPNMNLYKQWIDCTTVVKNREGHTAHAKFVEFIKRLAKMAENMKNAGPFSNQLTMNMPFLTDDINAFDSWFATACRICQQQSIKATAEKNMDIELTNALGSQLQLLANVCYIGQDSANNWPILALDKVGTRVNIPE